MLNSFLLDDFAPIVVSLFISALFCFNLAASAGECDESVLRVRDLAEINQRVLPVRVLGLSFLSFDLNKRPFCDSEGHSAIQLPGFLQIMTVQFSGEMHILRPLPPLNETSSLRLALTLEQNSVWVGRICDKGRSQSAFLTDDFCALSLCSILPDVCKSLGAIASKFSSQSGFPIVLPLSDLFPTDQPIALQPMPQLPLLEGYWKAEAEIQFRTSDKGKWTNTVVDDGDDDEHDHIILTRIGTENWHFISLDDGTHGEL